MARVLDQPVRPGVTRIERLVATIRERAQQETDRRLATLLTPTLRDGLVSTVSSSSPVAVMKAPRWRSPAAVMRFPQTTVGWLVDHLLPLGLDGCERMPAALTLELPRGTTPLPAVA